MTTPTIESLIPDELRPHIIGIWRFRESVGEPTWCTTYIYRGKFHDTWGRKTIAETLREALRDLRKVKNKKVRP